MLRRHLPFILCGLAVCVMAAPLLWLRDSWPSAAAADPLAQGDSPSSSNIIHLAQMAFAGQEQSPAAPDRSVKTSSTPVERPGRAAKPGPGEQSPKNTPTSHTPASTQSPSATNGPLSSDTIMSCLEVARDIDPELGRELVRKQDKNPAEFEQALRTGQVGRGLWSLVQLRQRDPHLYQLKIAEMTQSLQINRKAAELHEASKSGDGGRADSARNQLRELLQLQLAMSLKARAEYLCKIEEQVVKLREEIEHDAANFHAIVDARLKQHMESPPQADPTVILPAAAEKQPGERTSTSP